MFSHHRSMDAPQPRFTRLAQFAFAGVSLYFMFSSLYFHTFKIFRFLVVSMIVSAFWSLSLLTWEIYAYCRIPPQEPHPHHLATFATIDVILSMVSLAAVCSSASVLNFIRHNFETHWPAKLFELYDSSLAMAFFSWLFTAATALNSLRAVAKIDWNSLDWH